MSKHKNIKANKAKQTALPTGATIIDTPKAKVGIIPVIILVVVSIALYINTLWNDYALDDSMVLIRNSFTQKGTSGIGSIFKYDTFTGFWVFSENKARTERNKKIDEVVKKDINYEYDNQLLEIKPIIDDATSKEVETIINEYDDAINKEESKSVDRIVKEKQLLPGGRYRPLSLLTFAIEIELFGKDFYDENGKYIGKGCPAVNHAMNVIYFILTVLLLYIILARLIPRKDGSWWFSIPFIAALLFAFHPIHTEVVANIKGRDEILTLLGSLAALWCSIKYIDCKGYENTWQIWQRIIYLVLAGLALLCGLFSKENAIVFLAIIPLTLYYFTDAKWKIGIVMIPLTVAAVAFLIVRGMVLGEGQTEPLKELMNNPFCYMNFSEKFGTIFVTLLMYIKLLFIPHPLTYDYYPWQIPITELTNGLAVLSITIYFALGIYAIYGMIMKKDIASYSILFILIPLTPVCNIFFNVGTLMNERFIYISSIGFCMLVAWLFALVLPKLIKNISAAKSITCVFLGIVLCLFALKTITRNSDWKNDTVLFTTDVATSSESAKSNCGAGGRLLEHAEAIPQEKMEEMNKLQKKHDDLCDKAIKNLNKSNEIYARNAGKYDDRNNPVYVDAMNLLGNAYFETGDIANALNSYTKIIAAFPQHDIANGNIKVVLANTPRMLTDAKSDTINQKKCTSSIPDLLESISNLIKIKPECGEAYHILGVLYGRELGNIEASVQCFEKAETCEFEKTAAYYKDLGVAYGFSENYDKSILALEKAIELDPQDGQTYINIGFSYMNLGNTIKGQEYIAKGESLKQKK